MELPSACNGVFESHPSSNRVSTMTTRKLAAIWLLGSVLGHAQASEDCREIRKMAPEGTSLTMAERIDAPGKYCLVGDIESPRLYTIEGERYGYGQPVLKVMSSDVVADLQGHAIVANTGEMTGILLSRLDAHGRPTAHVSITNGTVATRTGNGILFEFFQGSLLSDFLTMYQGNTELASGAFTKLQSVSLDKYPLSEHVINSMKVQVNSGGGFRDAGLVGIGMKGSHNIIRNSTIEITDGHAAIYLFGPGNVIENNTIIFRGQSAFESAAAIKLHQADGTIIRNNDIVIDAPMFGKTPAAAIALVNSKGVVIENNRLRGIKTLVKAWDNKSDFSIVDDGKRNR
jgi:hypothetical protein